MKKNTIVLLLATCLFFITSQKIKASHAVGADITYAYAGVPNQYTVTLRFYRDCSGIPAPTTVTVNYTSPSGCFPTGNATLNPLANTGAEIPTSPFPPCTGTISTCNGGTGYGVQEWIYEGLVTLGGPCNDWVLSCEINARNPAITTITNPGASTLRVEAKLDNTNGLIDSSAVFSTYPVSRFCANHTFNYAQGALDPEGDSLVFSLVDALDFGGTIVPYINPPYNGTNPVTSVPPVAINPNTGVIDFTPTAIEVGIFAILVDMYRNGVWIGSIRRDMQVNIEQDCNFPPILHTSTFNGSPNTPGISINANCGDSVLIIRLPYPVQCSSVDTLGGDFRMLSPGGFPIPILAEIPLSCSAGTPPMTDSIEIHMYRPALSENGTYYIWSKVGNDGNTLLNDCVGNPTAMAEYDTASFYFNNCYRGIIDLKNVSVNTSNDKMEILWSIPDSMPVSQFSSYEILRSNYPDFGYSNVGFTHSPADTFYVDSSPSLNIPSHPYDYAVRLYLSLGTYSFVSPLSDTIQSIFMNCPILDTAMDTIRWTRYWGWSNPSYQLLQSENSSTGFTPIGPLTTDTFMVYTFPTVPGTYFLRVQTESGGNPNLLSRSNWCRFVIEPKQDSVWTVVPPNVFTPNGDGVNETFEWFNLEHYSDNKLTIFNRWGRKVYENNNYQNDWSGKDMNGKELVEGVYYYTMIVGDKNKTKLSGTVTLIRGK